MTRGRLLVRGVQTAVLVLLVWFIYRALEGELRQLTWADVARWRPDAVTLAASLALLVGVYIAHAFLWRTIVRDLKLGDLSVRDTVRVYFVASLGRYVPGKVWALAGMAVLAGRAGLAPVASTAAAVIGQIAFLSTGMLFLGVTLPQWRTELDGGAAYGPWAGALVIVLITGGALLWLAMATPWGHQLRDGIADRLGDRAGEKLRAAFLLADRISVRGAAAWALGYGLTWVALAAAFVIFVLAFAPDLAGEWRYLGGTIAASYLVGYLLPLPAGIGGRETVMIVLLRSVLPDAGAAVVISVLSRVWFTAAELVPLALLPILPAGRPKEDQI